MQIPAALRAAEVVCYRTGFKFFSEEDNAIRDR